VLAAPADVTAHADLLDARLSCNSSFAPVGQAGNAKAGTRSTGFAKILHLVGALGGGDRSAARPCSAKKPYEAFSAGTALCALDPLAIAVIPEHG